MSMKLRRFVFSIPVIVSTVVPAITAGMPNTAGADEKALAAEILEDAGVAGGLIVHVGCGDGKLTAALAAGDGYLVHGLDADQANVDKARASLLSLGVYGKVSVDRCDASRLPYADNMVNLVVSEDLGRIEMDEVVRVLAPGSVAYVKQGKKWNRTVKPRPGNIDEWTHFLRGADGNAVADDSVVGPPKHIQWVGKPRFARAHEQQASLSACVTTGGRMFYIVDEAPRADIRLRSQWSLVARDAFNGVVLWKRPIAEWVDQFRRFRSGPADLCFRLVAQDGRVYVTLGIDAPVSVLDAITGDTLWTYKDTDGARQLLRVDDKLLALIDTAPQTTAEADSEIRRGVQPAPGERTILAADASGDKTIWRTTISTFVHPALAAGGERLFYQTNENVHCLDLNTGRELWRVPFALDLKGHEAGWESPTLVVHEGIVYTADFKRLLALSAEDGHQLWDSPSSPGYNSPPDIFLIGGLLWKGKGGQRMALDPLTGEVVKEYEAKKGYMHPRCYRNKATNRFLVMNHTDLHFIDLETGVAWQDNCLRGTCQYGVMPANGLLYVPPDSCACNMKTKLNGLWALAAARDEGPGAKGEGKPGPRLERGPAYSSRQPTAYGLQPSSSWPTYRGNAARGGMADAPVPAKLAKAWQANLGGRLSAPVAADGRVYVASIDEHTIHALDAQDGSSLWSYTTGGRVDSPPTVWQGSVLFGSADGWIYALSASDGQLAWRFRAAPEDRRVFVRGQLESVWPVHGSVLVKDGQLIASAGRSSYLDGGIRLWRLDPATGNVISETTVYSPDPETGIQPTEEAVEMRGLLSDVMLADGRDIYMRHVKLDFDTGSDTGTGVHLFSPIGLLDDTWWHRAYWVMSDSFNSHWSGWWKTGNIVPSGRILSYDDSSIFGFGRDTYNKGNTGQWRGGERYQLFACDRDAGQQARLAATPDAAKGRKSKDSPPEPIGYRWTAEVPMLVTAMVAAGENLVIAGPPNLIRPEEPIGEAALVLANPEESLATFAGEKGGLFWVVSTDSGEKLAQYKLDSPPVFDGMAAAAGRVYLATKDGSVVCMAGKD